MEFRTALTGALKICGEQAGDPLLLYCALCDIAGGDLLLKPQLEGFHQFNKAFRLVETMAQNPEPRTIGLLLEKCKGQTDAPAKLCLQWIHTLFEFYYRARHAGDEDTEKILQALKADLFEPVQEGLILPHPQKGKRNPAKKRTPKAPQTATPAIPQKNVTPSIPAPPLQAHTPSGVKTSSLYIPDEAYVYLAEGSPTIHVSADCPHIRPSLGLTLYRSTYRRAKYKDYARVNNLQIHTWANYNLSKQHIPPTCPKCRDFTPILSRKNPKREYKQL